MGTGFTKASAVYFGSEPVVDFTVNADTSITVTTPAHVPGTFDLTVSSPGGLSAAVSGGRFTFNAASAPTVSGLSTHSGTTEGAATVTITGSNFTGASAVMFGDVGAASFTVNGSDTITAISPAQEPGTVHVTVFTPGGGTSAVSSSDTFAYSTGTAPSVSSLGSDTTGTTAGDTSVAITGTHFNGVTGVSFGDYPAEWFVVNSATSIIAYSPAQAAGNVHVRVTTYSGTSATSGSDTFTYTNAPRPDVAALSATSGYDAGRDEVVIVGSHFTGATSVMFGETSASFSVLSDSAILAVTPAHGDGSVAVTVGSYAGDSTTSAVFTFAAPPAPTVTGLGDSSGSTAGGYLVTVTGTNFQRVREVDFGGVPAPDFVVNSDTQLTVLAPPSSAGTVDIRVLTDGGLSAASSDDRFTFNAASAPTVTGLSSHTGTTAGGTAVSITGTDFTGATAVYFGGEPAAFTVNSATSITATAPAQAAGTVDVVVWTPTGSSSVSSNDTFSYSAAGTPSVTLMGDHAGTAAGGDLVSIQGSNFNAATGVSFGTVPAASFTVWSDSLITAVAPPQAAGTVDVRVTTHAGTSAAVGADTFTYSNASAPSVSALSASSGGTPGGTTVLITGTNFTGATGVSFGSTAALSFTVNSDTSITAVSPTHGAGTVHVTVTTYAGTSSISSADQFTYNNVTAPAPAVTAVSPNTGAAAGGQTIYLTGTNFAGATGVTFAGAISAAFFVLSDELIQVITPNYVPATVQITVTTNNGTSTAGGASQFTYYAAPQPVVSSLGTTSGTTAGGTSMAITGSNFTGATAVTFSGTPAASFVVNSATSITATSPALPVGTYNVVVTTPSGSSVSASFTVTAASAPTVSSLGTTTGTTAGGTSVSITGTNFTGAQAIYFGMVPAASFTVNSSTSITATAPPQYAGTIDVTVVTYAATSARSGNSRFTYTAGTTPAVSSLGTTTGNTAGGTSVSITGTNFTAATAVRFGEEPAASFTVNSATSITAVAPAQYAGTVHVTVETYSGVSASGSSDTFTSTNASAPSVSSLGTSSGTTAGGTSVTITGSNFTSALGVSFGDVAALSFTVSSATLIVAVAPPQAAGTVHVRVTTHAGTSSTGSGDQFTYSAASSPSVSAITPTSGGTTGGTLVSVTGSNFTGATGVSFGSSAAVYFTVLSDTALVALSPAGAAATVHVSVTTYAGTSSTSSADQFTYSAVSPPAVSSLGTSSGSTAGGTSVVITGSNFLGASGVSFGGTPATSFVVLGDSSISAVAPPHAAGVFDITVSSAAGTSALSSSDRFTFTAASAPAVSSLGTTTGTTAGGAGVTLTGTDFTGATGVYFGDYAAAFTVNSATSITAVAPSQAAGTIHVRVQTPTGTSAVSSSDTFTYTNASAPSVSGRSITGGSTAGGVVVKVTGSNFTGATGVKFGTTDAGFRVYSDGVLFATVPVHAAGTVHITVTTPSGTSSTSSSDQYTYSAASAPSVSSVAPNTGPTDGGTLVVVLGSGFTGATDVKFGSTSATSFTVLTDNAVMAVSPAGSAGTVDVRVTTDGGTSSVVSADHFTYPGELQLATPEDLERLARQGPLSVPRHWLTPEELVPLFEEAEARWRSSGVYTAALARFDDVRMEIAALAPGQLGLTLGTLVLISPNAAGLGWFIDATPSLDEEFSPVGEHELRANAGTAAVGRIDLLSVVQHELGHVLGLEHTGDHQLMGETLPVGVRRLPDGSRPVPPAAPPAVSVPPVDSVGSILGPMPDWSGAAPVGASVQPAVTLAPVAPVPLVTDPASPVEGAPVIPAPPVVADRVRPELVAALPRWETAAFAPYGGAFGEPGQYDRPAPELPRFAELFAAFPVALLEGQGNVPPTVDTRHGLDQVFEEWADRVDWDPVGVDDRGSHPRAA